MAKSYTYTINLKVNANNGKLRTADERMRNLKSSIRSLSSAMRRFNSILTTTTNNLSSFSTQLNKAKTNSDALAKNMDKVSSSTARNQKIRYDNRGITQRTKAVKKYGSELDSITQKSRYLEYMGGFSTSNKDRLKAYRQQYSQQTVAGRSISVASEKYGNLSDLATGYLGYMGVSSLKKYLYDTPVQAETNKWLLSTMGDNTANKDTLYNTLDTTTDKLPISMQSVAQPLYAFKAASGATAETINKIIPQFANFGAVVQNMTGSTELAETAMMKLSYGLQGKYAALDQYGITEKSLQDAGWSGDANDIEGYMNAVTKVAGDAGESMSLFAGKVKTVDKSLSRAGKQLWESGIGSFLTQLVSGVNDLLNVGNGAGGKLALGGATVTGAVVAVVTGIGYFKQALGSLRKALDLTSHDAIMSFKRLGSNLRGGYLGGKLGLDKSVPLEDVIVKSFAYKDSINNPKITRGLFDISTEDMRGAGINEGGIRRANKEKRKTKDFVKNFGYSDDVMAKLRATKKLPKEERAARAAEIMRGYKNDVAEMGFRERFSLAKKNAFRNVTFSDGKGSNRIGNALSRVIGSGRIRNSITDDVKNLNVKGGLKGTASAISSLVGGFSSLIPVINPATIALTAFTGAIAAIAGIMMYAYSVSDSFRQHVGVVGDKLKQLGSTVMNLVGDVFQSFGWSEHGGSQGVVDVAERILGAVEKIIDIIQSTLDDLRGTDPNRDKLYDDTYKEVHAAEERIRERQRAGKPESENAADRETMAHWYGDKDRGIASYKDYLTQTGEGTYFDEQRRKTNEKYGSNIPVGSSWEDLLTNRKELAWNSFKSDWGRTPKQIDESYNTNQETGQSAKKQYTEENFSKWTLTASKGTAMLFPSVAMPTLLGVSAGTEAAKMVTSPSPKPEISEDKFSTTGAGLVDAWTKNNLPQTESQGKDISNPLQQLVDAFSKIDLDSLNKKEEGASTESKDGTKEQGSGSSITPMVASNIPAMALNAGSYLQSLATDAWNTINGTNQTGLMQMTNDMTTGASLAYGQVPIQLQNQAPSVMTAGTNVGLSGTSGLSTGMSGMVQTASDKSSAAGSAVGNASGSANSGGSQLGSAANSGFSGTIDLGAIAKDAVSYVKENILAGIPDVVGAVMSLGSAATDATSKSINQQSPGDIAKVFGKEVEYARMLINNGTPNLVSTVLNMGRSTVRAFQQENPTIDFPVQSTFTGLNSSPPMSTALNEEIIHQSVRGTPSVTRSDTVPNTNNNNQTVNMTFNIEKVDSEERVHEIKDVIYETLFFNNETHGRQEPTPII